MSEINTSGLFCFNEDEINKNPTADDINIRSAILSCLGWNSHTRLDDLIIVVDKGNVCLCGKVQWTFQKMALASLILKVDGVKSLTNNIIVESKKT